MQKKKVVIVAVFSAFILTLAGLTIIHPAYQPSKNVDIYNFIFSKPNFETIRTRYGYFNIVTIADWPSIGDVGKPALPMVDICFLIPDYRVISGINVSYTTETIKTIYKVFPMQHEEPNSIKFINITDYDSKFYRQNKNVLNRVYDNQGISFIHGFPILTISLYPVDYNPYTYKLYWHKNITITFNYAEGSINNTYRRFTEDDINYLSSIVANPLALESYREPPPSTPPPTPPPTEKYPGGLCHPIDNIDYVIITNNKLRDAWIPLTEHRQSFNGFNTKIVTVEEINSCVDYWNNTVLFNDAQAHIREFCRDAYLDWNTSYVLLGGTWRDNDPSKQIVPYREFKMPGLGYTYNYMPCDLYYSNLDNIFWNETCWGGNWGKNKNSDTGSELFVGRITAYDTATVSNAIYKIIWYETSDLPDTWLQSCCFIGANLGWTVTSKQYMEELRLGTGTFNKYIGFEEFDNAHSEYDLNTNYRYYDADLGGNWSIYFKNNIGNFSIVNHVGHSSWNMPFSITNWKAYRTNYPFFGWSQGCLAGRYSEGDSGADLISYYKDTPAYALVLNTGYGWGSGSSTSGASQNQEVLFWDYFFNAKQDNPDEWQLGKAKAYQNDKYVLSSSLWSSSATYSWYSSTLFGDPALTLRFN